jgi:hypothetical protein
MASSRTAYDLGNRLQRVALPVTIQSGSLTSLQQRLFKTGGRLVRHARSFRLQLAGSHLTQRLFAKILRREGETEHSWREYLSAGWSPRANLRKMGRRLAEAMSGLG